MVLTDKTMAKNQTLTMQQLRTDASIVNNEIHNLSQTYLPIMTLADKTAISTTIQHFKNPVNFIKLTACKSEKEKL